MISPLLAPTNEQQNYFFQLMPLLTSIFLHKEKLLNWAPPLFAFLRPKISINLLKNAKTGPTTH